MALVARPMVVRLWFKDNDGAESSCQVSIPAATTYSSALSFLSGSGALASALSSAGLIGADLLIRQAENTAPAPGVDSDVNRHGLFVFGDDPSGLAVVRVPSISLAMLESSGPYAGIAIDQSAPAVAAFVAALASGLAGVLACDPLAIDLGELATAYMQQT